MWVSIGALCLPSENCGLTLRIDSLAASLDPGRART